MSMRPSDAGDLHIFVRGTMVSTDSFRPSILNRAFLEATGMPNKNGKIHVDGHILGCEWIPPKNEMVKVWVIVQKPAPPPSGDGWGDGGCCVA